jgi:transcriptional regulator with XRE-family HTH domain
MTRAKSKCSAEGLRLRRLRLKLQFTQEGLAHRVGVTTHTIWRLENDPVFSPRLETLRALAHTLGVDIVDLLSSSREKS